MQTDPNETITVPLRARDGSIKGVAVIDREDADLAVHRWCLSSTGYAMRATSRHEPGGRRYVALHRAILGLPKGDPRQGDHINGDKLNNCRANLRIVTPAENSQNVPARPREGRLSSRHRGVHWSRAADRWVAQVTVGGKMVHIGCFANEAHAAAAACAYRDAQMPFAVQGR